MESHEPQAFEGGLADVLRNIDLLDNLHSLKGVSESAGDGSRDSSGQKVEPNAAFW